MQEQVPIEKVKSIVNGAHLKTQYSISVNAEAYGACCVEIRNVEFGNLVWRKRSFEPDFENELHRKLNQHS
ncbi:MAG: hypothetical protein CBC55_01395 [Gammaproteobacteria bacterium TMED95]|uniref:Uncharacterized protein n=1 Tax=Alteromonas mediterranea TaxID=314275 RepID=A0AAC9NTZ1_9ALTE|nr:hypothetical protein [Alteromonas mediterranea]APD92236.1 hypothetical protein BM524_20180 [Alteromonas mediterranea]APE00091.1 hypothetical protein BM525_20375 [Alteromonas mediterranea]OUV23306.1 MAG: hypothetical protein CBC55_01395 [Gammaproteobacteria bacterium TMED95]|tara:strand:- start:1184 stop:1396 length:213 start_codon:yes stop_codon:yes gene_type:complete